MHRILVCIREGTVWMNILVPLITSTVMVGIGITPHRSIVLPGR
ncbi:MAG: hypothetical protein ABI945_01895 [Nitrospirales bacterium]